MKEEKGINSRGEKCPYGHESDKKAVEHVSTRVVRKRQIQKENDTMVDGVLRIIIVRTILYNEPARN